MGTGMQAHDQAQRRDDARRQPKAETGCPGCFHTSACGETHSAAVDFFPISSRGVRNEANPSKDSAGMKTSCAGRLQGYLCPAYQDDAFCYSARLEECSKESPRRYQSPTIAV